MIDNSKLNITRRSLIGSSSVLIAGSMLSGGRVLNAGSRTANPEIVSEEIMFAIITKALDVAQSAGASYAEVRMERRLSQNLFQKDDRVTGIELRDSASLNIGIRALVDGRWGHASSNQLEDNELERLAHAAVSQARANSARHVRKDYWLRRDAVEGRYISDGIDPFLITTEEKIDFLNSWRVAVRDYRSSTFAAQLGDCSIGYSRIESAYVNTEGSKQYSIVYNVNGKLPLTGVFKNVQPLSKPRPLLCEGLQYQQGGWDVVRRAAPHDQIPELVERSAQYSMVSMSPVDIGRYDIVCDPVTVAHMIGSTIVRGAEIDRAVGYEANAGGTSFLGPDLDKHLGNPVAASQVNISANRDLPGGMSTIPWDAEGSPVRRFDLVREGRLVDYITNHELSPLLSKWYQTSGKEAGSNGCAWQSNSGHFPITGLPNIRIEPGQDGDISALVANVKRGYYLEDFDNVSVSFQCQDGFAVGLAREIVNGRLGNYVSLGLMFDTTELLKNTQGIGSSDSSEHIPFSYWKGQPRQGGMSTIEAVPMSFSNVAIIDPRRRS